MSPGDSALCYASRWSVFPCQWRGEGRKRPLTARGYLDASRDLQIINEWWREWPEALIGVPSGRENGFVALDIDVKRPEANGYDTLDDLGFGILPATAIVHTATGGLHLYFARPALGLRNTGGARGRGIGPGLDWRGDGGYVIVPSPGSGYSWDPHWNLDTVVALVEVPLALLPRTDDRDPDTKPQPVKPEIGLSPYASAALDNASKNIIRASAGEQEETINGEAYSIGTLAGAGAIPPEFARRVLIWAARQIPSYDSHRPWRAAELDRKVERAFDDGLRHPREVRHHG